MLSASRLTWSIWNKKQKSNQQNRRQKLSYERRSIRPSCFHIVRTLVDTRANKLRQINQSLIHDNDESTKVCRGCLGPIWNHKVCSKTNSQSGDGSSNYHGGVRACDGLDDWADNRCECGRRETRATAIASANGAGDQCSNYSKGECRPVYQSLMSSWDIVCLKVWVIFSKVMIIPI